MLPRQGLTQLLQPLLVAWAQQGDGRTDAALATLRPFLDGQRFRGVYALHAALIADQAGRTAEAAKLYRQRADRIRRHEPAPRADPGELRRRATAISARRSASSPGWPATHRT